MMSKWSVLLPPCRLFALNNPDASGRSQRRDIASGQSPRNSTVS
jgi:hypothetical protein